jgi:GTP-binding protein Era
MPKSGFVGILGKPNAGKSTLLNWLLGEKIALVSPKANASRKRVNAIVMYGENQIILLDTPGLHEKEKLLNKFMLKEALKALSDSDLVLFLADVRDDLSGYEWFLELNTKKIPHILVLTKTDLVTEEEIKNKINDYKQLGKALDIIPIVLLQEKEKTNY